MKRYTMSLELPDDVSIEDFENAMLSGITGIECTYRFDEVKEKTRTGTGEKIKECDYDALAAKVHDKLMDEYMSDFPGNGEKAPEDKGLLWLKAGVEELFLKTSLEIEDVYKAICDIAEKEGVTQVNILKLVEKTNLYKIKNTACIRKDFAKALDDVECGSNLSGKLNYEFSDQDIEVLAILHKNDTDNRFREKIEDLLEDCNFHTECGDFADGRYDDYINGRVNEQEILSSIREVEQERE